MWFDVLAKQMLDYGHGPAISQYDIALIVADSVCVAIWQSLCPFTLYRRKLPTASVLLFHKEIMLPAACRDARHFVHKSSATFVVAPWPSPNSSIINVIQNTLNAWGSFLADNIQFTICSWRMKTGPVVAQSILSSESL
ncbi:hypothetical protein D3C86_1422730 [compost metagenome]